MATYILGHQKPDLDSVAAAVALAELKTKLNQPAAAAITQAVNPETEFVLNHFGLTPPPVLSAVALKPEDQVILVDHNEADQRLEGLNPEQIVEIIDHHKLNLNLTRPIAVTVLPWGSTAAIIFDLFRRHNQSLEKPIAGLLLAAVLSDTVGLRSATTTEFDRQAVTALAPLSAVSDLDAFTLELFKAKSNLSALTPDQIVKNDYKIFDFAQKTFISQIETVEQDSLLSARKEELLQSLSAVKKETGVALIFLAVSDILNVNTKLLILSAPEQQAAEKAFGGRTVDGVLDIGPRLSRKKEIAPALETAIAA